MKKIFFYVSFLTALMIFTGEGIHAQTTVKKKTSTSTKKRSTLVGAGAGAVTGAVVSKKKGKGALIGGAVGAGAGYLYGRHKDKKHPKKVVKTKVTTKQ